AHANAFHGSFSVTFTVKLSTAWMSFTKAMNEFVFCALRGQAQIVSQAGAPAVPDRCRFIPNTTAAASYAVPSVNLILGLILKVHSVKSALLVSDSASRGSYLPV